MIDFLIKSTASLAILLACYHLLLEKEKMHQFNRFFLLFGLVFSFSIPFFTIEVIKEVTTKTLPLDAFQLMQNPTASVQEATNYRMILLYTVYGAVTLVLLIRFIKNGLQLYIRSKSQTAIPFQNAKLVLLSNPTLPYTFLNTIFINKEDYNNRKIEHELYTHELIHVTQKHTLDILLIETLKVVFWFNPLFYFYKKAIQLNHEFLADEQVVQSHNNVPFYQNLLISKANANPTYYLASNLNYSVTKKRLIMMTKNTSTTRSLIKKGLVIPVLTAILFSFCTKVVAQEKPTNKVLKSVSDESVKTNQNKDQYYAGVRIIVKKNDNTIVLDKVYEQLSTEEKNRYLVYVPKKREQKAPTEKEFEEFKNTIKYAIWINNVNAPNTKLNNYKNTDFVYYAGSSVAKNARSKKFPQPYQYAFYTLDYFNKNLKNAHLKHSGKKIVIYKS